MQVKVAIPEAHISKPVLDAGLEAVTRLNEQLLANGEVPTWDEALSSGVRWAPEPPGAEHFDSADRVMRRHKGDCDDLAPFAAATMRHTGEDPGATAEVYRSGPTRWHAIVKRSDGSIYDPSKDAGMGPNVPAMQRHEMQGVHGALMGVHGLAGFGVGAACHPMMVPPQQAHGVGGHVGAYILRPQLAIRPTDQGLLEARADIPWAYLDHEIYDKPTPLQMAMTTLRTAPVPSTALTGAIDDAVELGQLCGAADPEHIDALCAIADGCEGASYEYLAEVYGEECADRAAAVLGSLFGRIIRGAGHLARGAVRFVPGVGPIADQALHMASPLFRGHRRAPPPPPAPMPRRPPSSSLPYPPPRAAPEPPVFLPHPAPAAGPPFAAVEDQPPGARNLVVHFH